MFSCGLCVVAILLGSISCQPWTNTSSCYGPDVRCTQFKIQCQPGERIALGSLQYGRKSNQTCIYGISDCGTQNVRACCQYNPPDELVDFTEQNRTTVVSLCEGKESCTGDSPRWPKTPSTNYVVIQYACLNERHTATTTVQTYTTTPESTTTTSKKSSTRNANIWTTVSATDHQITSATSSGSFSSSTSVDTGPPTISSGYEQAFISNSTSTALDSAVHTTDAYFTPTPSVSTGSEYTSSDSVTSGRTLIIHSDETTYTAEVTSPDPYVKSKDPYVTSPDPSATPPNPNGKDIFTATTTASPTVPEAPRSGSSMPAVSTSTSGISDFVTRVSFSSIRKQTNEIRTPSTSSVENKTHVGINIDATLETNNTDPGSTSDRGLIIGLTIGILLTIILVVGVLVVCFFKRMKRKENVRRNYIRNTNIFYSFPQDHEDTDSTESNRHIAGNHLNGDVTAKVETSDNDTVQNSTVILTLKPEHSHPSFDLYEHHESTDNPLYEPFVDDGTSDSVTKNKYTADTSSETIGFVNDSMQGGGSIARRPAHATKSVTFEASALYAQIVKEGRTKF